MDPFVFLHNFSSLLFWVVVDGPGDDKNLACVSFMVTRDVTRNVYALLRTRTMSAIYILLDRDIHWILGMMNEQLRHEITIVEGFNWPSRRRDARSRTDGNKIRVFFFIKKCFIVF